MSKKYKFTFLLKRIVLETSEHGHISVEISRGLKAAATQPMPVKDGIVLTSGAQELHMISTIGRTIGERHEKIIKLSVKLVSASQRGKKIDGDSKVLGSVEIDVADFVGDGDALSVQHARKARQYTYAVPYRSDAKKNITVETSLSAQQVGSTIDNSTDSNFSDMSSHDESSDDEICISKYSGLEQVFTGTDLLLSALKFQDDYSETDTPTSLAAPPMLGIGASKGSPQSAMMSGGVSDSPLNPVSWTISRIQASKAASGKEPTPIKPILVAKRRQHPDATSGDGAVQGRDKVGHVIVSLPPKGSRGQQRAPLQDLGRVSDEGEPCVAGGDESGLIAQNVSLKMDICSPEGDAAAKEELYATAKASLQVQEAQLLEQKSEISRLMVLLADSKRELGLAREREGMTQGESAGDAEPSGLESASTKIRLLQTQLDEALAQISQKNIVITEMESQNRKLDAIVVSSGTELSRCRVRLEEKGMELEGKNQENIHLKEKFDIADREMALLENDMKECEDQNKRLEQNVQKLQKQCKSVQKDLDEERLRADSEVERQREKAAELQGRISDLQGQVSSLSSKFQESQETVLEISEERDRLLLETLHAETQGNQHTQQNAQQLEEAKQSALQAMQRVLILEEGAAKLEKQCRHLGEMLAQREKELEESLTRQRAIEKQMNAMEDELQAATSQNRHLQERLLSCEARANKVQDESRRQINEMDVLLQRERTLSEARGQEQLDGRPAFAELEEHNRVLLHRISHLTADHKASADSLTAELQYANARILALEKGEIVKARDLQEASDYIELRTSERDKLAEQIQLLQERLSKTESELNIAQCSLLETQVALQNERDASTRMVQGLEAKCASASELLVTARASQQQEMQMQLECEKQNNEQRIAASEDKNRELQLESLLALQSAEDTVVDLQTQLTASRAETNSLQQMKEESEAENAVLKADFDKALSSTKDTIAQLKDMCARLETTLQTKQTALQTVREEVQTLQLTNSELVESLSRLRAECVHLKEARERIKLQEKEWELERQQWRKERYELEAQIDERAQEKEMERQAEAERKRESEEARQRILQQIEEAKAVSGGWGGGAFGGEADIAFCNILLGQEEMLRKGLSISESALLDIIEQRFPLLGFHQRERQNHRSQKQEWVENVSNVSKKDSQRRCSGGTHQVERLSKRPLSLTPERPQEFQRSEAAIVDSRGGTSGTDSGCGVQREERQRGSDVAVRSCSDSESTDINVYRVRVAELENDLQDARQAAQLESTVAQASQRQLVAVSDKVCTLEAQLQQLRTEGSGAQICQPAYASTTTSPHSNHDPDIIQQLIQARIAHAEAQGLALEMHRQNVQLKQVMEKFKQKFTKLEVKLYKVDEEQGTRAPQDQPPVKEEHSGTFGVRNALRNALWRGGSGSGGASGAAGAAGGAAGAAGGGAPAVALAGETKKTAGLESAEMREKEAKIKELSERLQALESLYTTLVDAQDD